MRVAKAVNVPLTYGGKATFMIQNILPAVLTGYVRGFPLDDIKMALDTFIPSPSQTPGRINIFNFQNFQVLVDYAHNSAGLKALKNMVDKMEATVKVGVIAGVGDRRDDDIREIGQVAAQAFDEIIIRQDKNLRGRTEDEIIGLLMEGIKAENADKSVVVIRSEREAINHVIENAVKGSLIVLCSDVVPDALDQIMNLKEQEAQKLYGFTTKDIPNR